MRKTAGRRRQWALPRWAGPVAVALVVVAATAAVVGLGNGDGVERLPDFGSTHPVAVDVRLERVIYRSPQDNAKDPGTNHYWITGQHCRPAEHPDTGKALGKYTAWNGAWLLADNSTVMHSFMQTTGPTAPYAKDCSNGSPAGTNVRPSTSFDRATSTQIVRESSDEGGRWRTVHAGDVLGTHPIPFTPQPTIALHRDEDQGIRANTLLRRVNGADLKDVEAYRGRPLTAFLQRLPPGADRWEDLPTRFGDGVILDPARFTYQLTRIRRLSDDRLVAVGAVAPAGATDLAAYQWLLLTSGDEGVTWESALTVPPGALAPNEWDVAEIPGGEGDLLAVMRTQLGGRQIRAQARLVKGATGETTTTGTPNTDGGWVMQQPRPAPPEQLPHSGHPELLAARVGSSGTPSVIIHFATTGVHYTADAGATWTPLPLGREEHGTAYYPRSVQTQDGTILVFGHRGADDPYRPDLNQAVIMDRFRLVPGPVAGGATGPTGPGG